MIKAGNRNGISNVYIGLISCFFVMAIHFNTSIFDENRVISAVIGKANVAEEQNENSNLKIIAYEKEETIQGLWKGHERVPGKEIDLSSIDIHIVVAYCSSDLGWIANHDKMRRFNYASTTIISKCGNPVEGVPEGSKIVELPNAGRNDHSFAYYITNLLDTVLAESNSDKDNSVVFFLKDNANKSNGWVHEIINMVEFAASDIGFACGTPGPQGYSAYADYDVLSSFSSPGYVQRYEVEGAKNAGFKSEYDNLRHWHTSLGVAPREELVQACFEGRFSASVSQIKKVEDGVWRKIEEDLRRGDNIEEGHFAERTWGMLLSAPLNLYQTEILKDFSFKISDFGGKLGVLCRDYTLQGCGQ